MPWLRLNVGRLGHGYSNARQVVLALMAGPQDLPWYKSLEIRTLGSHKSQVPGEQEFILNTVMVFERSFQERKHIELF